VVNSATRIPAKCVGELVGALRLKDGLLGMVTVLVCACLAESIGPLFLGRTTKEGVAVGLVLLG
jgi:hypothetical protein